MKSKLTKLIYVVCAASIVTPSTLLNQFSCDFETSLCGIQQLKSDNFDWERIKGATPSSRTGPSTDNTKVINFVKSVLYIYIAP